MTDWLWPTIAVSAAFILGASATLLAQEWWFHHSRIRTWWRTKSEKAIDRIPQGAYGR